MEKKKIFKPISCEKCPVVKIDKGIISCRCCRDLKAKYNNCDEKLEMYNKCQIDWDKEQESRT